jgi:hypothetical protein
MGRSKRWMSDDNLSTWPVFSANLGSPELEGKRGRRMNGVRFVYSQKLDNHSYEDSDGEDYPQTPISFPPDEQPPPITTKKKTRADNIHPSHYQGSGLPALVVLLFS